jgi:hypothetical protein
VNDPHYGAHSIINRITNELTQRNKLVDVLFFKDMLCGTKIRPCPKYGEMAETIGLMTAPDVFLFPVRVPSLDDPNPPTHTIDSLKLPKLVLELFNVQPNDIPIHIYEVRVSVAKMGEGKLRRTVQIWHEGKMIDESKAKSWRPQE